LERYLWEAFQLTVEIAIEDFNASLAQGLNQGREIEQELSIDFFLVAYGVIAMPVVSPILRLHVET
jgi:hypothetical protein